MNFVSQWYFTTLRPWLPTYLPVAPLSLMGIWGSNFTVSAVAPQRYCCCRLSWGEAVWPAWINLFDELIRVLIELSWFGVPTVLIWNGRSRKQEIKCWFTIYEATTHMFPFLLHPAYNGMVYLICWHENELVICRITWNCLDTPCFGSERSEKTGKVSFSHRDHHGHFLWSYSM